MPKANVTIEHLRGKSLTYLVPNGTKRGDVVMVPLPYFMSGYIGDFLEGVVAAVEGEDDAAFFAGPCRQARRRSMREEVTE